jgi:O-antigen/teichoic acid export membrane protein
LLALVSAALAALVFSQWLNLRLLGEPRYLPEFRLALLYFVLNTSFIFVQNLFRWAFQPRGYTIVTAFFALATLTLSLGLAATLPNPLAGVIAGLACGAGAGVGLSLFRLKGQLGIGIELAKLKRMLKFSLPLVPASCAIFLSTYASRFILNADLTLGDVGLFTWASQLAAIPALLLLGVQGAVTPLVMKHHNDPQAPALLARSFETIFVATLWLSVALGLFAPELVRLLGYSSYERAAPLVIILAPALLLLQLYVFAPGFAVAERTGLQLAVSIVGAIAAIVFNMLLVNAIGLTGAAIATLASSLVFIGCWFVFSHRLYPLPIRWRSILLFVIAAVGCSFVGTRAAGTGILGSIALKTALLTMLAAAMAMLHFLKIVQLRAFFGSALAHSGGTS